MISGEQASVQAMVAVALVEVVVMALEVLVLVHHIHRILRDMVHRQVQTINLHRHIPVDLLVVVHMTIGKLINQLRFATDRNISVRHLRIHHDMRLQHPRIPALILRLNEDIQVQQLVVIQ